jgi:hypothetical protein
LSSSLLALEDEEADDVELLLFVVVLDDEFDDKCDDLDI